MRHWEKPELPPEPEMLPLTRREQISRQAVQRSRRKRQVLLLAAFITCAAGVILTIIILNRTYPYNINH